MPSHLSKREKKPKKQQQQKTIDHALFFNTKKSGIYICFSGLDAFLGRNTLVTQQVKRLKYQIIFKKTGNNKTKGPKQDSQNRLRSESGFISEILFVVLQLVFSYVILQHYKRSIYT